MPDFARAESLKRIEPAQFLPSDRRGWEERTRAWSAIFKQYPAIVNSSVDFEEVQNIRYLVNSEGTEVRTPERVAFVRARARSQAPDGMFVYDAVLAQSRNSITLSGDPDIPKAIAFYRDVLGMRLSDRSGDLIAFMHGIHGSDHHMIAFVKSDGPGLHHLSWDVGSINDIGVGANHMADKGFAYGWGLGRHVLGSNYFHYVRDPWGSYAEYSCDIDYIPVTHDWKDGDHPPEDSFYMWGPAVPEDFAHNFEAAK